MSRILSIAVAFIACSLGLDAQVSTSWISRYSGPTNTHEFPSAMTVDAAGNAYVTGVQSPEGMPDLVTIKYGPSGAQAWVNIYGTSAISEYPTDIEVDAAGNVYVYGYTGTVAQSDLALFKFDSAGVQQWMRTFDGAIHDYPGRATVDGAGNIYLTGVRAFPSSSQFLTLKYDPAGNLLWSRVYPGGGQVASGDMMSDVAVNASGEVCVTGVFYAPGGFVTFVIKYDSNGALLWSATYPSALFAQRIVLDALGNVYVGTSGRVSPSELLVLKYNPTGTLLWGRAYDSPGSVDTTLNDMAVDSAGNVYLTGNSPGNGANDIVTVKFDTDGTKQWVSRYNNHVANSYDFARGIAVDSAGAVYVGGYTYGAGSQQDFLALKYDANGNQKWVFTYDQDGSPDFLYDFALSASGDVFLSGSADFLNTGNDILTLRLEQQAVIGLPEILLGPQDIEVIASRSDVTFSVLVESPTPVTYQWRFNGLDIADATQQTHTLRTPGAGAAGEYSVRVSNAVGVTATPEARLTVRVPPSVVIFTATPNVTEGRSLLINGYPSGDPPLRFQWRFNDRDLVGQTNRDLRLIAVTTNDTGSYALVVRNPWGDSMSTPIQISVSPRGPIDRWTWISPLPQGNELAAIAHGNGRYVAVGEEGTVVVSTNGRDWSVHSGDYGHFLDIAFGEGVFVAITQERQAYTSTDGVTWTIRRLPDTILNSPVRVVFGAGRFVILADRVVSSDDGISWVDHRPAVGFSEGLTYGNGIFLITASNGTLTSTNGMDWIQYSQSGPFAVVAGNGIFVGHNSFFILVSNDGLQWTQVLTMTNNSYIDGISFSNGRFYALGTSLLTSTDGYAWTQSISRPDAGLRLMSAAGISGQTIVVGDDGVIFGSIDGQTFAQIGGGSRNNYRAMIYENNRFTVVGNDGVLAYSYDGSNFIQVPVPATNNLRAIALGNGIYVVVGEGGALLTSADGFAWQRINLLNDGLYGVKFLNGHFIAVGESGRVLVSTNARDWTVAYANVTERFQGIAYGAGRYIATGQRGYYAVSTNAIHWSSVRNDNAGYLESIVYTNGLFVAVGSGGRIFTSPNGSQWTYRFTGNGQELESIIYVLGQFIAAGDRGTLMTSTDGTNWLAHRFLTQNSFRQIIYARGALWGVGNNEMVVKSGQLRPYVTLGSGPLSGRLVQVLAEPGQVIELQASENLSIWETLASGPASVEGAFTHIDSVQRPRRFYRVAP